MSVWFFMFKQSTHQAACHHGTGDCGHFRGDDDDARDGGDDHDDYHDGRVDGVDRLSCSVSHT